MRLIRCSIAPLMFVFVGPHAHTVQSEYLDFEAPDAFFSGGKGETYNENGNTYRHDKFNNDNNVGAFGLTTDQARAGDQSLFVTLPQQPDAAGFQPDGTSSRREWWLGEYARGDEAWYSIAVKFDEHYYAPKNGPYLFHQVRYIGSGFGFNVSLDILPSSNAAGPIPLGYRFFTGTNDTNPIDSGRLDTGFRFERDVWYDIVVNMKLNDNEDGSGFYRVWVNSQQVVDYAGDLGFSNVTKNNALRFGQYSNYFEPGERTIYFDEFRQGTTFADVAPVPEPGAFAVVALGVGSLVLAGRGLRPSPRGPRC